MPAESEALSGLVVVPSAVSSPQPVDIYRAKHKMLRKILAVQDLCVVRRLFFDDVVVIMASSVHNRAARVFSSPKLCFVYTPSWVSNVLSNTGTDGHDGAYIQSILIDLSSQGVSARSIRKASVSFCRSQSVSKTTYRPSKEIVALGCDQ